MIELANQGKITREIAKEVLVSLKTIGRILNKVIGDGDEEKEQRLESKSKYAQGFQMFKNGRQLVDVTIELDIETPTVICYYEEYLKLVNTRRLVTIYDELSDDLPLFLRLYGRIKKERLGKPQIVELLKIPNRLLDLKELICTINTFGTFTQRRCNLKRRLKKIEIIASKNHIGIS